MTIYVSTTSIDALKSIAGDRCIAMIDGTIPGWKRGYHDLHFDHHRHDGGKVQIDEIMPPQTISILDRETNVNASDANWDGGKVQWAIATTLTDADACVAAAYLQLPANVLTPQVLRRFRAIALDCDYLCIPPTEPEQELAEFASKAVAALKESSKGLGAELGLPEDRKTWNEAQRVQYASEAFKRGAEWLMDAAKGDRPWPGQEGEADAYFAQMQADIEALRQLKCVRIIEGAASTFLGASAPITLTARSMAVDLGSAESKMLIPGCQYTLGSLPYHASASALDLTQVFPVLAKAEGDRRGWIGQPPAQTTWGGRAAVGGSGFNDASLLQPDEVIQVALDVIGIPF